MVNKAERLEQVIERMFETVLHMEIWRNPAAMVASQGVPHITASVQVTGSWIGLISLTVPIALAESLAAIMFDIEEEDLNTEDVEDAMEVFLGDPCPRVIDAQAQPVLLVSNA